MNDPLLSRLTRTALNLLSLVLAACLGLIAWTGTLSRYWADDYCYAMVINQLGFIQGPMAWFLSSGNRFSTILAVGVQELFGPEAIRWTAFGVLLVWLLAWFVFLRSALRLRWELALAVALTQVFFAAISAPDRLQTLFWRMGTLHYTFPLALLLFNLSLAAAAARREKIHWGYAAGIFLLAFFAGGFSETYAAMQVGVYALGLAAGVVFAWVSGRGSTAEKHPAVVKHPAASHPSHEWLPRTLCALIPALLGGLAAMGLELLSPSNALRQASLPPPSSLWQLLYYTIRYTADFTRDTLRGLPIPLAVLALLSALLAYLAFWRVRETALPVKTALLGALAWLAAGLLVTASAISPSVFAGLQFPVGRALMPARFALLLGAAGAAATAAALLKRLPQAFQSRRIFDIIMAVVLLAAALYPLRALNSFVPQRREMAAWAARWDARHVQILALRAQGQQDLTVREVEVVNGLEDMGPNPANWVNRCAAGYYNVHTITATP